MKETEEQKQIIVENERIERIRRNVLSIIFLN